MTEILLGALAVWAFIHFGTQPAPSSTTAPPTQVAADGSLPTLTPATPVPTAQAIPSSPNAAVSGAYQVAQPSAIFPGVAHDLIRPPISRVAAMASSAGASPKWVDVISQAAGVVPSTPPPAPPPYVAGGIAGGVGAGGNPLGGWLVPGVSPGTGTTSPYTGPVVIA